MSRAGVLVKQPSGYRAFTPAPLPPRPPVAMDAALLNLLSEADRVIGRLDMVTEVLPNPDLFIGMYIRQEAVAASRLIPSHGMSPSGVGSSINLDVLPIPRA